MATLVLVGAGRMGQQILSLAGEYDFTVAAVVSRNQPAAMPGVTWFASLDELPQSPDLLIDFSRPAGTRAAVRWCQRHRVALLSGTTGLNEQEQARLQDLAEHVPVMWTANFSQGMQLCLELVQQAADRLQGQARVSVTDHHHAGKADAPSGSALALAAAGHAQAQDITSLREGDEVGRHEVVFTLQGEEVRISHAALERAIYARGALHAGQWLVRQPPGIYPPSAPLGSHADP